VGGIDLAQQAGRGAVEHRVLLPAAGADHLVAGGKVRVARFDHLTDRAALHHGVQRLRRRIALAVVHAAAHVGVQAQVVVAHQHLAVLGGHGLHMAEVGNAGLTVGHDATDLVVDKTHSDSW
jgi:hypothetical protein